MGGNIKQAVVLSLLMFSSFLAGCTSDDESSDDDSEIDLLIYYDETSGIIQENIQNGQQVSFDGVDLSFDFAYTKSSSGDIETFYFEAGDGSNRISVQANDTGEISYTYATHGLFTVTLGATDEAGNEENTTLTIRIDKHILWGQSGTTNPDTMDIDTRPDCECQSPNKIAVDSTVENPQNLANIGAGTVSVTWYLNGSESQSQSGQEQIADGQNAQWTHNELSPKAETWTLEVGLSQTNEQVNIDHDITISYDDQQSSPNPLPTEGSSTD